MKDLIIRILNEFKWKDGPNGGEPDLPPQRPKREGDFYRIKDRIKSFPYGDEYHYDTRGGRWHIRPASVRGHPNGDWTYTHEDYDPTPYETGGPPGDIRHGHAKSAEDCANEIDNIYPETHDHDI